MTVKLEWGHRCRLALSQPECQPHCKTGILPVLPSLLTDPSSASAPSPLCRRGEEGRGHIPPASLAPRQRGEGGRRPRGGWLGAASHQPLIRLRHLLPSAGGEKEVAGTSLQRPSPRVSGERVAEGRVRGWLGAASHQPLIRLRHLLPSAGGEKEVAGTSLQRPSPRV